MNILIQLWILLRHFHSEITLLKASKTDREYSQIHRWREIHINQTHTEITEMLPLRLFSTAKTYFTCFPMILTAVVKLLNDFFYSYSCCFLKLCAMTEYHSLHCLVLPEWRECNSTNIKPGIYFFNSVTDRPYLPWRTYYSPLIHALVHN